MRSPTSLAAAATLLLAACSYDFKNPAERLDSGEVTGRVVADTSGNGQLTPVGGASVALKNSANVQSTRENGLFFMMGLVPGRHTLLLTQGTEWALQRDVEISWGSDGQPESVLLGDLRLRRSVNMGGTFSVAIDAYQPTPPTAFVFDEETGARADAVPEVDGLGNYTGRFSYSFPSAPVGPHRLRYAVGAYQWSWPTVFVGGPLTQDIPETSEGQSLTLTQPTLHVPMIGATGKLRFRVQVPVGAALPAVIVASTAAGPSLAGVPAPDSSGLFEWDVDEGVYFVRLDLGAAAATLQAPAEVQAVVIAGQTTDLGALTVVDPLLVVRADTACLAPSDCGAGFDCAGGQCVMPACFVGDFSLECSMAFSNCPSLTPCNGGLGWCGELTGVCVPKGVSVCLQSGSQPVVPACGQPF